MSDGRFAGPECRNFDALLVDEWHVCAACPGRDNGQVSVFSTPPLGQRSPDARRDEERRHEGTTEKEGAACGVKHGGGPLRWLEGCHVEPLCLLPAQTTIRRPSGTLPTLRRREPETVVKCVPAGCRVVSTSEVDNSPHARPPGCKDLLRGLTHWP